MNKLIGLFTLLLMNWQWVTAQNQVEQEQIKTQTGIRISDNSSISGVNNLDTLVFDISQAVVNGSYVEIPVSFLSDDTIVSVDFSFKYNETNFLCDSIFDLTTYLQELWYYNSNDSIMRFTSYSLQNIPNDTALVRIRFNTFSGQFCASDLNTVKGYLNGDACSIKIVPCIPNGMLDLYSEEKEFSVYPNPAGTIIHIETSHPSTVELLDVSGRSISSYMDAKGAHIFSLDVSELANGIYLLGVESENSRKIKRIIVTH